LKFLLLGRYYVEFGRNEGGPWIVLTCYPKYHHGGGERDGQEDHPNYQRVLQGSHLVLANYDGQHYGPERVRGRYRLQVLEKVDPSGEQTSARIQGLTWRQRWRWHTDQEQRQRIKVGLWGGSKDWVVLLVEQKQRQSAVVAAAVVAELRKKMASLGVNQRIGVDDG
jgi:hypothetical protein